MLLIFIPMFILLNLTSFLGWIFDIDIGGSGSFYSTMQELLYGTNMSEEAAWTVCLLGITGSIIFSVLYGTYLYRQIDIQGIFYFVRQPSRKKWLIRSTFHLFLITFLWSFLQVMGAFAVAAVFTKAVIDIQVAGLFAMLLLMIAAFNFFVVYMVNLFSIRYGSVISFIIVYLLLLMSFVIRSSLEHKYPVAYFLPTEVHFWEWNEEISLNIGGLLALNKNIIISFFVLLLYIFGLVFAAYARVDYWDIGLENRENKFL